MVELVSYFLPRKMSADDLNRALRDGDDRAKQEYGTFTRSQKTNGQVMTVRWLQSPFMQSEPAQQDQASGSATMATNITGASFLGSTLKDRIAQSKAKVAQVHTDIVTSLDNLDSAAASGAQMAKSIQAEADDLTASLGQFTNAPASGE